MLKQLIVFCFLMALGAGVCWYMLRHTPEPAAQNPAVKHHHTGLTIQQVQAMSALVTLRVDLSEVLETDLAGYTGGMRAAILVRGDVQLASDLGAAQFQSMDNENRKVTLVLAPPQANQPRLDHARTKAHSIDRHGLWQAVLADGPQAKLLNQAYLEAQHLVESVGRDRALLERCRRQTESVLGEFLRSLGWDVTIRWSDQPSNDVP